MTEQRFLLCVPWEMRRVPSERVTCTVCGTALAVALSSREYQMRKEMQPICIACVPPVESAFGGFLVGDRAFHNIGEAMRAIQLERTKN